MAACAWEGGRRGVGGVACVCSCAHIGNMRGLENLTEYLVFPTSSH